MAMDDIEASLQPGLLIRMSPAEFNSHLHSLVASAPPNYHEAVITAITRQLQSHVHSNAIPPNLFTIWLPTALSQYPHLLKDILGDQESSGVRKAGRRMLRRTGRRWNWCEDGWEALGGVESVRALVNSLSASDAHALLLSIATGAKNNQIAKSSAVDELVLALFDGSNEAQRLRPSQIAHLLTACSTPFIIQWLSKDPPPSFPLSILVKSLSTSRPDLLRNIATGAVEVHPEVRSFLMMNLPSELIFSVSPYKPGYTYIELSLSSRPGIHFCFDLLHAIQANPLLKNGLSAQSILNFVQIAEKHAIKHKSSFDDILRLLQLGLDTASAQDYKANIKLWDSLPVALLHYWAFAQCPDFVPSVSIKHNKHPLSGLSHPSRPNEKHCEALKELLVRITESMTESDIPAGGLFHTINLRLPLLASQHFACGAKLPLIKLLCRHVSTVLVDLDSPQLTVEEWKRINLDVIILTQIPCSDSKWLFNRLPNLAVAENLLQFKIGGTPWSSVESEKPWWFKYGLLQVMWEAKQAHTKDGFDDTLKLLENVKRQAERSRDPNTRSSWAVRATEVAILSNNVDILKIVIMWAKRYRHDHEVYPRIIEKLVNPTVASLLSCVKLPPNRRPSSLLELSDLVDEANSVFALYIEAGLLYHEQDDYLNFVFSNLGSLLLEVFIERVQGVKALQRSGLGSEDKLTSILIEPMAAILMLYEETSLTEGNEDLTWDTVNGPLGAFARSWPYHQYTLPFLDNLARRRDKLWTQVRLKRNETVATLGPGWPKGLPIQCLLPSEKWAMQALANPAAAPFVAERVEQIVFCDAEIALARVPRNTEVVGPFVDSLPFAIRSYIGNGPSADVLNKIQLVWDHYSQIIPSAAGHVEMVKSLLMRIASAAGVEWQKEVVRPLVAPSLPVLDSYSGVDLSPVEWDPWPDRESRKDMITESDDDVIESGKEDEKPKNLLLARFSAREVISNRQWRDLSFMKPQNWSPPKRIQRPMRNVWGQWANDKVYELSMSNRDALVISAILYLDAFTGQKDRLLSEQFPVGALHPRYPQLYLSYEFLSDMGKFEDIKTCVSDAILALEKLKSIVPARLLRELANSMLNKLFAIANDAPTYHILVSAAFKIISLLSRTDQPHLASDMALKVIEAMPDSSWGHRKVLSIGLCKRLSSKHNEEMIRSVSHFILNSLNIQQDDRTSKKIDTFPQIETAKPPSKKYVKITTVKLLVELLQNGDLLSNEFSAGVLQLIFVTSNHIDIKTAALSAVLTLLGKSIRLGIQPDARIYKTLTLFSTAAAGPDERSNVSEAEWAAAENGGPLPECDNSRPLLALFVSAAFNMPESLCEDYVRNVLFKILDESTRQHNRWMRAFLSRINLSPEESSVTNFGPFDSHFPNELLSNWSRYISKHYLLRHRVLTMGYLDICKLGGINQKLNSQDPLWGQTIAGEHWRYYCNSHRDYRASFNLIGQFILSGFTESTVTNGITSEDVENEYCERVAIAVRQPYYCPNELPIVSLKPFEYAFDYLLPSTHMDSMTGGRTRSLERIIADVASVEIKPWQNGTCEKPPVLPSLWKLRCAFTRTLPPAKLAKSLDALCDKCAQSPFAIDDYQHLVSAIRSIASDDHLFVLIELGNAAQNRHDTFAQCIKVDLARDLLQRISVTTANTSSEIQSLLKSWLKSENENVRRIAFAEMERIAT